MDWTLLSTVIPPGEILTRNVKYYDRLVIISEKGSGKYSYFQGSTRNCYHKKGKELKLNQPLTIPRGFTVKIHNYTQSDLIISESLERY